MKIEEARKLLVGLVDQVESEPFSTAESRQQTQFGSELVQSSISGYRGQNVSLNTLAIIRLLTTQFAIFGGRFIVSLKPGDFDYHGVLTGDDCSERTWEIFGF